MKSTIFRRDMHAYKPGSIGREVERRTGTPLAVGIFLLFALIGLVLLFLGFIIGIAL
ncbi:MAG: hypothetical protein IPN74_09535 [Haliscomenobacter sp.]|nr:hypothetical protein [Haliscomenobacter sp.]